MNAITDARAINLGAALSVVSAFLDFVARNDSAGQMNLKHSPEYVAARCVLDRLCRTEEPA